jgi:putative ABC transport system ATP-binding protein
MSSPLVEIRGLTKAYVRGKQRVEVLHGINLDIPRGDFVALMGPSGSGKTTLLNLIGGLDSPTGGLLTVEGQRIDDLGSDELAAWRASTVGFIFQSYNLMPVLTAQKNVELPLLLADMNAGERARRASVALKLVGLDERARHKPNELSGGQRQRVAIARALVMGPAILLADEPTGNLDSTTGEEIMRLFEKLHGAGNTIILVTHERDIAEHAHRVIMIRDGKIASDEMSRKAS